MFTVMFNQAPAKDPLWTRMMSKVDDEKSDSETIEFKPLDISHVELYEGIVTMYTSDEEGFYFTMDKCDAGQIARAYLLGAVDSVDDFIEYLDAVKK
jgi:hypothetical protein